MDETQKENPSSGSKLTTDFNYKLTIAWPNLIQLENIRLGCRLHGIRHYGFISWGTSFLFT
ncbi:hypothetical protein CBL_05177 [Carabus blaptoides fortunei]